MVVMMMSINEWTDDVKSSLCISIQWWLMRAMKKDQTYDTYVSYLPIRWHLAMAWMSFWGFQSESKIMTVSAAVRLIPTPPALVDNRNTKLSDSRLNRSMDFWRSFPAMRPSSRSQLYLRYSQNSSMKSIIFTIWEKISTYHVCMYVRIYVCMYVSDTSVEW